MSVCKFHLCFVLCVCSLSGRGYPDELCKDLESAIKSITSNLRELELSGNIMRGLLCSLLSVVLFSPKLEKLR